MQIYLLDYHLIAIHAIHVIELAKQPVTTYIVSATMATGFMTMDTMKAYPLSVLFL